MTIVPNMQAMEVEKTKPLPVSVIDVPPLPLFGEIPLSIGS